ncbi:LysR family transcriptional regulator [Marivibrio halodurans]|uniref:LysR family transcriptional regulator n=1 Tax=Marivibrio halodurans TaxID=2039722 RepID=A0A8J7V0B0_9PROT|nr:LysR family transcriptional regulator [Marivibrio halodurans]MBP5856606.1 LysR family transcriptional regulator [Marivibrio halodurans]
MSLSLNALRAFAVTADTGSVTRAAEILHRTPSAVSMTLKQLEAEIGPPLFEGERKGTLTPTGHAVLAEARAALDRFDRAEAAIRAHAAGAAGRLVLSATPSATTHLLPEALVAFRARFPDVEIDLHDADSARVAEELLAGTVELGIASAPTTAQGLAFQPLYRDALGLVCRADDPLAAMTGPIGWAHLTGRTVMAHALSPSTPLPSAGGATSHGDEGAVTARTVTAALALVRAGLGVTILPRLTVPGADGDLAFVEMDGASAPPRTVGLLTRKGESLSAPARMFLETLGPCLDRLAGRLGGTFERL